MPYKNNCLKKTVTVPILIIVGLFITACICFKIFDRPYLSLQRFLSINTAWGGIEPGKGAVEEFIILAGSSRNSQPARPSKDAAISYNRIDKLIQKSEEFRNRFARKREARLHLQSNDLSEIDPWTPLFFWDYFPPTFTCPYLVERVGAVGDGGKWVCGLDLISDDLKNSVPPCIVYSFGVGPDSTFELEFLERTSCLVYGYDYTAMGLQLNKGTYDAQRIRFEKFGLANRTEGVFRTLGDIMRRNDHAFIDFLKVDVEGAEFAVFEQVMNEFEELPFRHLNLEVHLDYPVDPNDTKYVSKYAKTFKNFYKFWTRLEDKGLRAFSWEVNHYPCVRMHTKPLAYEYSFINLKYISTTSISSVQSY